MRVISKNINRVQNTRSNVTTLSTLKVIIKRNHYRINHSNTIRKKSSVYFSQKVKQFYSC